MDEEYVVTSPADLSLRGVDRYLDTDPGVGAWLRLKRLREQERDTQIALAHVEDYLCDVTAVDDIDEVFELLGLRSMPESL